MENEYTIRELLDSVDNLKKVYKELKQLYKEAING